VNEPESGWFSDHVVSTLVAHGGRHMRWDIEVHAPDTYSDGEEGAPFVYCIRKTERRVPRATAHTEDEREAYTIKQFNY